MSLQGILDFAVEAFLRLSDELSLLLTHEGLNRWILPLPVAMKKIPSQVPDFADHGMCECRGIVSDRESAPSSLIKKCWDLSKLSSWRMQTSCFSMVSASPPYKGSHPLIIIAIDVGTTFSGVSYMILKPNQTPQKYNVNYKGLGNQHGSHKVPTVLLYDSEGSLQECGAKAVHKYRNNASGTKTELFKLLMAPDSLKAPLDDFRKINFPKGHTLTDVLADWLRYLNDCAVESIQTTLSDGPSLWSTLGDNAQYILSHPNGWEGKQRDQIRSAAAAAGLVGRSAAEQNRLNFITEGEASFHWCLDRGLVDGALSDGGQIVVADAGGGTIDVSSFRVSSLFPLKLEETSVPECRVAGSMFVTAAFEKFIEAKLQGSRFSDPAYLEDIVEKFDEDIKCSFEDEKNDIYIKVGSRKDNEPKVGITSGQLELSGSDIAQTFEKSCSEAVDAIRKQVNGNKEAYVFLVGGFASSSWLFEQVKARLRGSVCSVTHSPAHAGKAVSDGALVYYLDHLVCSRVAKHTYGFPLSVPFDPDDPEHVKRRPKVFKCPISGEELIPEGFTAVVTKGQLITEGKEYRLQIARTMGMFHPLIMAVQFLRYVGDNLSIGFLDEDEESSFEEVGVFRTDIILPSSLALVPGPQGQYLVFPACAILTFGADEVKCQIEWMEEGTLQRSPTTTISEKAME